MQDSEVRSAVNYLQHMEELPVFYSERQQDNNLKLASHEIRVTNARRLRQEPSLDDMGFTLARHASTVRDFTGGHRMLRNSGLSPRCSTSVRAIGGTTSRT